MAAGGQADENDWGLRLSIIDSPINPIKCDFLESFVVGSLLLLLGSDFAVRNA